MEIDTSSVALPDRNLSTERFSDRVDNYVKYRPSYPDEAVTHLAERFCLSLGAQIADIGSGTGISSLAFISAGFRVWGVEPNATMRYAAEKSLAACPHFTSVNGTAEATSLEPHSMDLAVAAQAFHWFDNASARKEFRRIVRPGGGAALIWNERQLRTTPFLSAYEDLLLKYAEDYHKVRHDNIGNDHLKKFFGGEFETAIFQNEQTLDLTGLIGRTLSSSYIPNEGSEGFDAMLKDLEELFAKHAESGRIKVFYETKVFLCCI